MAKTRLNVRHREAMLDFALSKIQSDSALQKKKTKLYEKAADLVRKGMLKKYPEEDLKVLRKYSLVSLDNYVQVQVSQESSEIERFNFSKEDIEAWNVPETTDGSWSKPVYWLGAAAGKAVVEYERARVELREADNRARTDFKALIWNARHFEDAVEAWAPFAEIAADICKQSTALTTLSEDTKERISKYKLQKEK